MLNKILSLVFVLGVFIAFTSCNDCQDCTVTTLLEDVEVSSNTTEVCGDEDIDAVEATELLTTDPTTGAVSGIRVDCE